MYKLVVKSNLVLFGTLIVLNIYRKLSDYDQRTQLVAYKSRT